MALQGQVCNTAFLTSEAGQDRYATSTNYSQEGHLEIVKGRLYWADVYSPPPSSSSSSSSSSYLYFSVDNELIYEPFFADFGPLNLGCTYRYIQKLRALLDDPQHSRKQIVHYCSVDPKKRANAAYLMACFLVIALRRTSDEALAPFRSVRPPFLPFRDATSGICHYQCTVADCVKGLEYACKLGWWNLDSFNLAAYEYYEQVQHGDMNWIIPNRFLAFAGPNATNVDHEGYPCHTPDDYLKTFHQANIGLVVRLNKKQYDRRRFLDAGIKHVDLYFLDGSCPSKQIIDNFLLSTESEPCATAVHCKAGLGRTGTLIGLYAQKHFQFPARYWIGWNRICRPGSVLGPQQQFLNDMERQMFQAGAAHRATISQTISLRSLTGEEAQEDVGQGDRLVGAKRGVDNRNGAAANTTSSKPTSSIFRPGSWGMAKTAPSLKDMFGTAPENVDGSMGGITVG